MGSMDLWLRWFVVLHGGFHDGADFESFVVVLVVVFSGDAHGVCFGGGGGASFFGGACGG
ncbi:hypothetical protein MTR_1g060290 [Medicago truncatula]|uniref:Uncharacterized protein n=1 Tax=Medicago truncatula TaxID=3880 RepID=A0A072VKT2_MEDTR|nr:hypothetical protein MTR_1g060290 [Medicago truncatula]